MGGGLRFQASDTGLLTATIPTAVDAPVIEVYTQGMMPLTLSEGEHELSVAVEEGAAYVLYMAGGSHPRNSRPRSNSTSLTPRPPRAVRATTRTWRTPSIPRATAVVSPRDALVVINALNRDGQVNADAGLLYLDVTGDEASRHAMLVGDQRLESR